MVADFMRYFSQIPIYLIVLDFVRYFTKIKYVNCLLEILPFAFCLFSFVFLSFCLFVFFSFCLFVFLSFCLCVFVSLSLSLSLFRTVEDCLVKAGFTQNSLEHSKLKVGWDGWDGWDGIYLRPLLPLEHRQRC